MGAPQPIEHPHMESFAALNRTWFAPWEVEMIEALDGIYMNPPAAVPVPEGQVAAASASNPAGVRAIMASVGNRRAVKRDGR